jgi:acetyl esterase/lipase
MRPDTGEARETFIKAGRHRMHAYGQPGFEREADTRVTVSCRDTDGALVAETEFTLCFRAPEVEIRPLRHGRLRGLIWGPADDSPGQGVVFTLGGSGGGVDISTAPLLASLGYRVISLAYFAYEDLPKQLHDIPLEYFTEGFAWARQTYDVERVAILGASRGGELVLLLGATYPDAICGVVAQIPMHVIMGGYSDEGKPAASWTLNERRLPFVPIDDDALETPEDPEEEVAWTAVSDRFLKDPALTRGAEIEVEGIRCPLLLVSGEDDAMWDSPWGADRVLDRLRAKGSPIPVQHLKLRDTGHLLGMPNRVMSLLGPIVHPQLPIKLSVGGRAAGTAREAWRHWATLTGFLETCFSGFLPRDFARRRRVGVAE